MPVRHLEGARAAFELHNSPLSEYACLGFEYGYAVTAPEALVVWEAQYGDFANGAADHHRPVHHRRAGQVAADLAADPAAAARLRGIRAGALVRAPGAFPGLGAEGNIRVVYPTTPAQYFHLLRRQALHKDLRPLVVMAPKSLLRLPAASSAVAELSVGGFHPVLDDPSVRGEEQAAGIRHVILCSGKVYYDIVTSEERAAHADVAVVRVEYLYPFPTDDLAEVLRRYAGVQRVSWVQEEPRNMGARKFVLPKIRHLVPFKIPLGDISRPERSRPAEGYPAAHAAEQARIVREALTS